jgi:hypothetical protein
MLFSKEYLSVPEHFLLVASDSQTSNGGELSGFRVALRRLKARKWSVYKRTPNRARIKTGDRVLIYAAGKKAGGGTFVASATISQISPPPRLTSMHTDEVQSDIPAAVLELSEVNLFELPPDIQEIRGELTFIPNHKKWGAVLQGGCKNIDKADFDTIIRFANRVNE